MTARAVKVKNIVISHVYSSDNKGDAALTSVLISDIKRKFNGAKITILRLELAQKRGVFEGVPEMPSFMAYALNRYKNPLIKLCYTAYMVCATLLYAWCLRTTGRHLYLPHHLRVIANIYEQADLIVPVGGGYIRSRAGLANRLNIPLILHPLLFGDILRKPTVLYSQSVGPFQNRLECKMVAFVLKRMTLILLREDKSVALLTKLGVTGNVERAVDSGFLLKNKHNLNVRNKYKIPANKMLIGVTVRSWLNGSQQTKYEQAVAKALDWMIANTEAHILFVPQVTAAKGDDDRLVSRRVRQQMVHAKAATLVKDTPDHHQIKAIYDGLDMLLGTRFHSVIFSLTSFVPVLAIEYEHKTSGIMHDLGLDNWVIKIEHVTGRKLIEMLQKLQCDSGEYREYLHKTVPAYVQKANEAADLMALSYNRIVEV